MNFRESIKEYTSAPFSRHLVLDLLKEYKRPNDKISELVKAGLLTILKNGLYVPGTKSRLNTAEPFLIANHLWGPSYVSMESALSYWGLIPERVHEITSMTTKATKRYQNAIGRFTYKHLDVPYYSLGIKQVTLKDRQTAMIASPEKALCDKIIATPGVFLRSIKQTMEFLVEDLRIEEDYLRGLHVSEIETWIKYAPKRASLEIFIKTLAGL